MSSQVPTRFFRLFLGVAVLTSGYLAVQFISGAVSDARIHQASMTVGKGQTGNLRKAFERWESGYAGTPREEIPVGLLWNKGLSSEYSSARGMATVNTASGIVNIKVEGLDDHDIADVWLLDRTARKEYSDAASDRLIRVGQLAFDNDVAVMRAQLRPEQLESFELNWVIVSRRDQAPLEHGVLFGSTSLFQRVYHYPGNNPRPWERADMAAVFSSGTAVADGILPPHIPDAGLINEGRDIFFNETFEGNGRTCGTCHPENNNFTIDPKFIATLPDDDPLFLAERPAPNPLAENFEKPELMRRVGLILENTNGFDDLENNFTMRSVPHLLAVRTSVSPPTPAANDGTTVPPDERTGWSGDGAPVNLAIVPQLRGTVRDFSVGAVIQHFPKTLGREAGVDFRLPTEHELDALEAFVLSLGRQEEFDDLSMITLTDERADTGRRNYMGEDLANGVPCNACHFNGGANTDPDFDFPAAITPPAFEATNRSFAPRVEELIDQPGDIVAGGQLPFDDGFAKGTNLFNVPTVVEAADTGPFFHSNQIDTVEGLISFYSSQRHLRNGDVLGPIVGLNGAQVANVGAFMRVINADENARSAIALVENAGQLFRRKDRATNLRIAKAEINDALEVLEGGHLHFDDAVPLFRKSLKQIHRRQLAGAANTLRQARNAMIVR